MDVLEQAYLIEPLDGFEARYGKPILLTDCEIAVVLDAMRDTEPQTSDGQDAKDRLWMKLLRAWDQEEAKLVMS